MNPEKLSLTTAPSNLLDSNSHTWAEEFARSAVWGGLQSPLLGAAQVVDKTFDTELQRMVQFMPSPPEAKSNGHWHAQQLGAMTGMAIPFLLLHKGVGFCGNRLLGTLERNASTSLLTRRAVQESVATGMLFDGLLRPVSEEQQDNFVAARAKNAIIGGITFGVLAGSTIGIKSVMQSEKGLAASMVRSEIGSAMISGVPAGLVNAELTSRLYTGEGASAQKLLESVYNFAVLGGTMALGKRSIATSAESKLSHQLRQKSEVAEKQGLGEIEQRLLSGRSSDSGSGKAKFSSAEVETALPTLTVEAHRAVEPTSQMRAAEPPRPLELGPRLPTAEMTAEIIPVSGGGTLKLLSDGRAILKDSSIAGAVETKLNYRSMGEDITGREFVLLYELKATPAETAATISMFARQGKAAPIEIDSSLGYYAEPWATWQTSELAALLKSIPSGSKPIGVGAYRQAWLTPDNQVVVIGPYQQRPDCPFLRAPIKVFQPGRSHQIEFFEYADPRGITYAEVKAFDALMREAGWEVKDSKPMNYAKSADGKMWRVDPDDVYRVTKP